MAAVERVAAGSAAAGVAAARVAGSGGVEGVAGQEAVIAWQRTVLFPQGEV
jgi:hypothetical protein